MAQTYTGANGSVIHWFGDEAIKEMRRATAKALRATGIEAVKRVKLSMGGANRFSAAERKAARLTKAGKKRKINAAAPRHRPRSAPGQPPAVQTGRLRNSIGYEVSRRGGMLQMRFGSIKLVDGGPVEYAAALEFGYPAARLFARPYLRPQIHWALKFFMNRLRTLQRMQAAEPAIETWAEQMGGIAPGTVEMR